MHLEEVSDKQHEGIGGFHKCKLKKVIMLRIQSRRAGGEN
jgi:hypothetical protein